MEQKFRSILLLIALVMANAISAQKFIRYQMNDNTYNGFYTASIDSIKYAYDNSSVETITYIDDLRYHIPITKIDSITFEGASTEKNGFDGYRIYEVNRPDEIFKKIYVDNRSVVMMSQTGEFSKNDTILIASAYNQFKYLICTDENGAIVRIFDEEELYFINYGENENIDIFTSNGDIYSTQLTTFQEAGIYAFCQQLKEILTAIDKKHIPLKGWSKAAKYSTEFIFTLLQKIQKESIVKDKVLITDETLKEEDESGVIASTEKIQGSPGKDAFILYIVTVIKEGDETSKKLKEKNPKEKQAEAYRKYYNKKYDIRLSALPPDSKSITQTSAQLKGELYTAEITRRGKAYFLLSSENDKGKEIAATEEYIGNNSYVLTAKADGLIANKEYTYTVLYKCKVHGLEFTYTSEKQPFKTLPLEPTATTGEATKVKQESATVECTYQNVPQGAVCGVEFWIKDEQPQKQNATENKDGKQSIDLSNLQIGTSYNYKAYIEYNGKFYYANNKGTFTTLSPTVTTGKVTNVKQESATVECTYQNIPQGAVCGVEFWSKNEQAKKQNAAEYKDGKQSIDLSNLQIGTSYNYKAYIEYNGKFYYADNEGTFTTLSPAATTGGATNVKQESATVECTYQNVPQGAVCGVEFWIKDEQPQKQNATENKDGKQSIDLSNLQIGTSYNYKAYIEYNGKFYYANNKGTFTTLSPAVTTGKVTNVKQESATVECTYQNVPQGAVCGVEFWSKNEQAKKQSVPSTTDGSQSISLFGLQVSTNYSYRAYLEYKGNIYYGQIKTFTTKPVDLSGTWTLNINGYGKARTLTLTEEGGVIESTEVSESFNGGTWTVQGNTCTIGKVIVIGTAYVTFTLKGEFEGSAPTKITGIKYNENYNEVVGSVTGPSTSFIMTR